MYFLYSHTSYSHVMKFKFSLGCLWSNSKPQSRFSGGRYPDKFSWGLRHLSWFPNQKLRTKDVVFPSQNYTAVFSRWMIKKYPILDSDSSLRTADVATTGNTSAVLRLPWFEKAQNLTLSYTKTVEATEKGSKFIPHNATQANDGVPLPGDLHFIDLCSVI